MIHRHIIIAVFATAVCLGTSGCFKQPAPSAPGPEVYWPKPPEIPRIQFLTAVSVPADLGVRPGMAERFVDYIIGYPPASVVSPYGITSDSGGRLYVVDTFLKQVHVFDADANRYFSFPDDKHLLDEPVGIAVDPNGLIYVTDARRGVVKIFKDQGREFVADLDGGVFKRPTGIAANPATSELLVVDTLLSQVFRYDLSSHRLKGSFGGNGSADGRFHYPTHVCAAPDGNIIVTDSLNFRVQVFSPAGRFLYTFGRMGHGPGNFSRPKGTACDSEGNIYVVDALFDNVQVFDRMGRLLMAFGDHGNGAGKFRLPAGIHIDNNDVIYVSDSGNQRFQMFQYLKEGFVK